MGVGMKDSNFMKHENTNKTKKQTTLRAADAATEAKTKTATKARNSEETFDEFQYLGISPRARVFYDYFKKNYENNEDGYGVIIKWDFAILATLSSALAALESCNKQVANGQPLYYLTPKNTYAAHPIRDEISMHQKRILDCSVQLALTPKERRRRQWPMIDSFMNTGRKSNTKTQEDTLREAAESEFI